MTAVLRLLRLPMRQQVLVGQAVLALALARLALSVMPFRWIAGWLGAMQEPATGTDQATSEQAERAGEVRWVIAAVADRLPFECKCLSRALAARALCRWRGLPSTLHLGAAAGQLGEAETHAWIDSRGLPISGYPLPVGMVEIGCFPDRQGGRHA